MIYLSVLCFFQKKSPKASHDAINFKSKAIKIFKEYTDDNNQKLLLVTTPGPTASEITTNRNIKLDLQSSRMRVIAEKHNVPFLDLTSDFNQEGPRPSPATNIFKANWKLQASIPSFQKLLDSYGNARLVNACVTGVLARL